MIQSSFQKWIVNGGVVIAFAISGLLHLSGHSTPLEIYDRWGFPQQFSDIIGLFELQAALLLALPGARMAGSVIAGFVSLSAIVTVLLSGGGGNVTIPLLLFCAVLFNAWMSPPAPERKEF